MILAVLGLVTIAAAPQRRDAEFNKVTAQELFIENDASLLQVGLGANEIGGLLGIYNKTGEGVAQLRADQHGNGPNVATGATVNRP